VSMVVTPAVPREGEPVLATFKLNNPLSQPLTTDYQFFANGELIADGTSTIAPGSYETQQYAYRNPLQMGDQIHFLVRTESKLGNHEKAVSTPAYPPQIWSSFVSFASFSTSVMSSMSTMTYFMLTFQSTTVLGTVGGIGINAGAIFATVLIGLLAFLEITRPMVLDKSIAVVGRLKLRFGTVTWILLIIFLGIIYTRVVMIFTA